MNAHYMPDESRVLSAKLARAEAQLREVRRIAERIQGGDEATLRAGVTAILAEVRTK